MAKEKEENKEKAHEHKVEKKEKPHVQESAGEKTHARKEHKEEKETVLYKDREAKHHSKQDAAFDWVEYKPKEIEEAIISLANAGHLPSEIGMILRDQYGIPDIKKVSNERLQKILERHKLLQEVPEDLLNLIKKSVKLDRHLTQNKKDMTAKRGLQLTVSKIRKLAKYYHKTKKLSKDWDYTPERAALLIK